MQKPDLAAMSVDELKQFAASLLGSLEAKDLAIQAQQQEIEARDLAIRTQSAQLHVKDLTISKLTHEMAILKRWRFGKASEAFHGLQRSLLEESIDEDLGAIEVELEVLRAPVMPKKVPVRAHLPVDLARVEIRHEPDSTVCPCGCQMVRIGEDVAEKLDYVPGTFQVERHIRGKWTCKTCEKIVQAPVAPAAIDKGIPTAGLLAQVLIAKYADHLPLYRQEEIYARSGVPIPRSTMAEWVGACGVKLQPLGDALRALLKNRSVLHADETPMPTLRPGTGKTHRSYLWAYGTTPYDPDPIVVYDFAPGRSGEHARAFLDGWKGSLVCDDFSGYKALFADGAVVEIGCMAHARRKFHELFANHQSVIAGEALTFYGALYEVERKAKELALDADGRRALRQAEAVPVAAKLHAWLLKALVEVAPKSATEKAIRYTLGRWDALTRYLNDGHLPIDNNWLENRIRPVALGRNNWLFAGSDRAGRRSAVIMSLIQTAKLHDLDPYVYLRDVLERLPLTPYRRLNELLPGAWKRNRITH
jgi:transposase